MSDTPRTDNASDHVNNIHNDWVCSNGYPDVAVIVVPVGVAKQLERELAEAKAEIAIMRELVGDRYPNSRQLEAHIKANRELAASKATTQKLYKGAFEQQERIKRLVEAGDAMAKDFSHFWTDRQSVRDWPKAKEGL